MKLKLCYYSTIWYGGINGSNICRKKQSCKRNSSRIKRRNWYKLIADSESHKFTSTAEQQLICPKCKKPLMKFDWGYSCTGYKEGCKFHINKKIAGKSITENQVIMLCKNGKTSLIKGFKGKSGKEFNAYLVLKDDFSVGFEFESKK